MKASQAKLSKLIGHSEKQFIVPIYQRSYKWTKSNITQYINDLEEIDLVVPDQTHFLNSIVYSKVNDNELASAIGNRLEKYHIIDGQQRLTTTTLYLIAIRNILQEKDDTKTADRINNQYIVNQYIDDIDESIRLKLASNDLEVFRKLVLNDELNKENKKHLIYRNYNDFYKYIKKNEISIYELIEKFENRIDIIDTFLEPHDNPQKIFSSLNSTGKALKNSDLIKNFILMNLKDSEQVELYTRFWQEIERILNNDEDLLLTFLQHYLTMNLEYVISKGNTYASFEKYFNNKQKSTIYLTVKSILEDLLEFSKIYHKLFLEKRNFESSQYSLNYLNIESYYPLLLKVEKNNPNLTEKVANIIENYLVRRIIVGLPPGKTKNIFAKIIKNIKNIKSVSLDNDILNILKEDQGQGRYPTDTEFSKSIFISQLYSNNQRGTKYILYKIEYYLNTQNRSMTIPYESLTIEHILPETDYKKLPKCWTDNFDIDKFDQYVHTLGNLTLITQRKNSSLGNECFNNKNNQYANDTFLLTKSLKNNKDWTLNSINDRANYLMQIMLKIWK
jgi:uncharacterized protein with ParB-like and HNH nuclease domain